MDASPLTIWALMIGEAPFKIMIPSNCIVQDLKDRIREEKSNVLPGITLPEPIDFSPQDSLTERLNQMHDAGQTVRLRNLQDLSNVWPEQPTPGVHVFFMRPNIPVPQNNALNPAGALRSREQSFLAWPPRVQRIFTTRPEADRGHTSAEEQAPSHETSMIFDDVKKSGSAIDGAGCIYLGIPAVPEGSQYVYLEKVGDIRRTLLSTTAITDVLVVAPEYHSLRKTIEASDRRGIVGPSEFDTTAFLLYPLLNLLEHQLPTAVQFNVQYYFIFDEQGATIHRTDQLDLRLRRCLALTDTTTLVEQPCAAFQVLAKRIVQASEPEDNTWKRWLKRTDGVCIVSPG
ncbi:uncharacterized protein STEHIDRAFT_151203 [Stereum hirsutum FP-91666 SS1]|uniref:uncharacterized protein n=1 Tax=Stereum hirsutum (strain FP-91666) TaxID=721885 RepID=UPI000440E0E4|nr:uncharacterized protein STEHIDRAFT_151203 [Stereum hirsutum FP-91666 SS1]EIM91846.1 hypothetical protein STEHIDRAFT_151203 [Stereum hirsutum FP-91666 SS1]